MIRYGKRISSRPDFFSAEVLPADLGDLQIAQDLLETITAHRESCVGMAANMIGASKRVIVFDDSGKFSVMFNPEIIAKSEPYKTSEGCLSLLGEPRPTTRFKK